VGPLAPPPPPPGRFASLPRPARRTDTLATRALRAPVRVCAGGDVTLGTNLDTTWARLARERMRAQFARTDDPETLVAPLRPMFRGADIALVNVESAVGEGPAPSKCGPTSTKCFAFRAPPATGAALRSLAPRRVVVGNLANNHARDAGNPGQDSTVAALTRAGVLVTGDDTLPTLVPLPDGDTVAVLGFYTSRETPDVRDTAAVRRHVARAADHFPAVIVTMHLGAEGRDAQRARDSTELYLGIDRGNPIAFADAAVRGGAALVVGHGPHVLRAMEWRERGALIAYSLGNLLTYGPFVLKEPLDRGAVLCATIGRSARVTAATLAPTFQRAPGVLERDRRARAIALVDSLGRLDFPATGARLTARGTLRPRSGR
jgi:poly-gamma-glutamate capsule biosynthesis protein CapA/YwtB (metallophosphatase superfamily)